MQMTLSSLLTKWMTFIVPWRFLRQLRRNSAYMYLGRKTKIQNLGAGESTPCLPVCGHSLEEVTEFTYRGSVQSTTGRCQPDIIRRIGIASTAMHSMNKVWRQTRLQLQTKLRLYQTSILFKRQLKTVLSWRFKLATQSVCQRDAGSLFQACGPATENALDPTADDTRGTSKQPLSADHR